MWAVVGLGNPGVRYWKTRHNLGFMVIDRLSERFCPAWSEETRRYHWASVRFEGEVSTVLVKPITYMNQSGRAVADVARRFALAPEEILVIVDDVHLPLGKIRVRQRGSHGGHNGLLSVIEELVSQDFPRIRLGIDHPAEAVDLMEYVLGEFDCAELPVVAEMIETAVKTVESFIVMGAERTMNTFNR